MYPINISTLETEELSVVQDNDGLLYAISYHLLLSRCEKALLPKTMVWLKSVNVSIIHCTVELAYVASPELFWPALPVFTCHDEDVGLDFERQSQIASILLRHLLVSDKSCY